MRRWAWLGNLLCCALCALTWVLAAAAQQGNSPALLCKPPDLAEAPRLTRTQAGIPGDPVNVALVGTEGQLIQAMLQAEWRAADPITLRSCLRIAASTVFHLSYKTAPVSNLYLDNRKEDLAFEIPVGKGVRRRHHVRFWRFPESDPQGRPVWLGAATYDAGIELSRTKGLFTHRIAPDIDAERNKLFADLNRSGGIEQSWAIEHFQQQLAGQNGGGDPYHTDGRLLVGVLAPLQDAGQR